MNTAQHYTLYGAELSLYTGKIRAYLRYKEIPFEEVMSTKKVYEKIIVPNTGVRFIPVLQTPEGKYLQDTAVMIDQLELDFPKRKIIPSTSKQALISAMFEMWGDEWLLLPAMHYRWNKENFPFIYEEFGSFVTPGMPAFIRRYIGKKVGAKFRSFVPLLGIKPHTQAAIEDWYENHVLPLLDKHFAEHNYLLGGRPCVGDYGLMGPLYAHLYRDPAPGRLMREKAPNVAKWVERMNSNNQQMGDWLANDEIPSTLFELLQRQLDEFWPVACEVADITQEWMSVNPEQLELPRSVGESDFTMGNTKGRKAAASFTQWKLQRVLDVYKALDSEAQDSVNDFFSTFATKGLFAYEFNNRVARQNNRLVRA
ncbi:glutathione S-transferase [Glaciecola sp. MH2013]|uniref:glutathione S-transferase family protein n=1 Tax=Glaciecola sp. MH2013 TaxID=2785524 RepID=UPI00189E6BFB|nr:glutathione S-transferase family protein [Glaciecola sp. MH2013]MBF7073800.1 glutathione S-transferase [Glaciecola sp. MH2013]